MPTETPAPRHIRLTSHSGGFGALPVNWGAATPAERGPVVGTTTTRAHRNVIGTHSGSYSVTPRAMRSAPTPRGSASWRTRSRSTRPLTS